MLFPIGRAANVSRPWRSESRPPACAIPEGDARDWTRADRCGVVERAASQARASQVGWNWIGAGVAVRLSCSQRGNVDQDLLARSRDSAIAAFAAVGHPDRRCPRSTPTRCRSNRNDRTAPDLRHRMQRASSLRPWRPPFGRSTPSGLRRGWHSPGVLAAVVTARRAFPLGFARQPLAAKRTVGRSIVPRHPNDRLRWPAKPSFRLPRESARDVVAVRFAGLLMHTFEVFFVRHLGLVEQKSVHVHGVRGLFVALATPSAPIVKVPPARVTCHRAARLARRPLAPVAVAATLTRMRARVLRRLVPVAENTARQSQRSAQDRERAFPVRHAGQRAGAVLSSTLSETRRLLDALSVGFEPGQTHLQ